MNYKDAYLNIILRYVGPTRLRDWIPRDRIDWVGLSENSNNAAIEMLNTCPENINWACLSRNSNDAAIEMLKGNPEKIHWQWLSGNSNIFTYDFRIMEKLRLFMLK